MGADPGDGRAARKCAPGVVPARHGPGGIPDGRRRQPGGGRGRAHSAPANGSVLALDPDIPPSRQRAAARPGGGCTRDGAMALACGGQDRPPTGALARALAQWLPWPGRHRIELVAADGRVLDSVRSSARRRRALARLPFVRRSGSKNVNGAALWRSGDAAAQDRREKGKSLSVPLFFLLTMGAPSCRAVACRAARCWRRCWPAPAWPQGRRRPRA
jgi:hypothetical protein